MTIRVIGCVDENHRLSAEVPESVSAGPVEVLIEIPHGIGDEPNADAWAVMIGQAWADELVDKTQGIYTLDDGEPVDERR